MGPPLRLTVVMTHPVQYVAPWFRYIAARCPEIALTVLYGTQPTPAQQGAGFERAFTWDVPLTQGYSCQVVRPPRPGDDVRSDRLWGLDVPEVVASVRESKPDVVLIPGWHSMTLLRALRGCRRLGVPVLYRGDTNLAAAPVGWRRPLWVSRTRFLLRRFDGYLSVGQRARAYLQHFGIPATRIFDSPHGVDAEFFSTAAAPYQSAEARRAARQGFGLRPDDFVVLFVGKLEPKKRPSDLVQAMASLGPGASLLVVGAGVLTSACKSAAHRLGVRAAWPGFLNQSELGRAYAAADCLVLPSDGRETWGLVVNEAMATGLPCVVSDRVGCAPDLVIPGETGEVFPMGDVAGLAHALGAIQQQRGAGHDFAPACVARAEALSFAAASAGLVAACRAVAASPAHAATTTPASATPRIVACCSGMVVVSGLERSTFEVLRTLRERGAAVHCVVNSWENHRIVELVEDIGASWSTAYHWYPLDRHTRNPVAWARAGWDIVRTSLGLLRDTWDFRPTHVLVPEPLAVVRNWPALLVLRLLKLSVILRLGNAPPTSPFYRKLWRGAIEPAVDRVVCNSRYVRDAVLALGVRRSKAELIYSALPVRPLRASNGAGRDPHKAIYVGQVIPEKGVDLLLEAVAHLATRHAGVRLDVVGRIDGWVAPAYTGYRERLLARAAAPDLHGRVRFLGWRDDVPALMAQAGVHCCPSRPEMLEGLPLVILEAKNAGIPSVAFPVGPFPEIIAHRETGWICTNVSAAALAEGLEYFLADAERQARAGAAAHRSLAQFERRHFADAWWRLLRERGA